MSDPQPVIRSIRKALRWLVAATVAIALGLGFVGYQAYRIADDAQTASDQAGRVTTDSRELGCGIARLVSFVPAIQFQGEPLSNFVGWIRSRHDLLDTVRATGVCSDRTTEILAHRVQLDERLLRQIEREP